MTSLPTVLRDRRAAEPPAGAATPAGRSVPSPWSPNSPLPKGSAWSDMVFGHFRNTEMARDNRFKLVLRNDGEGPNELFDVVNDAVKLTNQYENPQFGDRPSADGRRLACVARKNELTGRGGEASQK